MDPLVVMTPISTWTGSLTDLHMGFGHSPFDIGNDIHIEVGMRRFVMI